jgi:hypothetical protein
MINSAPEIDISGLNDTGYDIFFLFGIKNDTTVASGRIVSGQVGIAGLPPVYNQTFGTVEFHQYKSAIYGSLWIFWAWIL